MNSFVGAPFASTAKSGGPIIIELPIDKIRRPLMRTRANDPEKVKELMQSIQEIGLQVPVCDSLRSLLGSQIEPTANLPTFVLKIINHES